MSLILTLQTQDLFTLALILTQPHVISDMKN